MKIQFLASLDRLGISGKCGSIFWHGSIQWGLRNLGCLLLLLQPQVEHTTMEAVCLTRVYFLLLLLCFFLVLHSSCHAKSFKPGMQCNVWGRASAKEPACQCRRHKRCGFNPWVRKIPWRRTWQPPPVFLPRESHGQRRLAGYSLWGCRESDMTEVT